MRYLRTAQQVVDALGGDAAVRKMCEASDKVVWHWTGTGMFPANRYDKMIRALRRRGCTAPAWLWNQQGAKKRAA